METLGPMISTVDTSWAADWRALQETRVKRHLFQRVSLAVQWYNSVAFNTFLPKLGRRLVA